MKSTLKLIALLGCAIIATAQQNPVPKPAPEEPVPKDAETDEGIVISAGHTMQGIPLATLLEEYSTLVGKTLIPALNLPSVTFDFKTNNDLTYEEAKSFYETLLEQRKISVVPQGAKFIQVIPSAEVAKTLPEDVGDLSTAILPESERPVMGYYKIQHLDFAKTAETFLTPFAKAPKAVMVDESSKLVIIRDSALNVRRMQSLLKQLDVPKPQEQYRVVPVKYAKASTIVSALLVIKQGRDSSVQVAGQQRVTGITGGATGGRQPNTQSGRTSTQSGRGSTTGQLQNIRAGAQNTSGRGGSSNETVLKQMFQRVAIADNSYSNEILLVGPADEVDKVEALIGELDVLPKQVLIEAIIIDVALGDTKNFGISLRQNKQGLNDEGQLSGALASALGPASFTDTSISGATTGFNYWGFLGNNWEVAVNAIQNDSRVTMHSRPRIQTAHATEAKLFIGDTRPVVTGTITDISGGTSSQYQLQKFGITLNVVPYINDEGLVVMDIAQQIQDIVGSQTINGNAVPIVTDRTVETQLMVRDGEMVVLGGFIKTKTTTYEDGVPILRDIPLLGKLFEKTQDIDERSELLVLMRPTVLDTPEAAAIKATSEQANLPGVDLAKDEEKRLHDKYRRLVDDIRTKNEQEKKQEEQQEAPGNLKDQPLIPKLP
jgi:type II secretory pathway component GspD/PulD (secretin)